jgi:predicted 3-demethylubiquinone-9 3-methyltransferase (glyoxalase superfamily)
MNKITPFLWFNDNAEDAAEFYLSVFPQAKKNSALTRSGGWEHPLHQPSRHVG